MNITNAITQIYPQLINGVDYSLIDYSDGNGTHIINWLSQDPIPTEQELQTASDAYDAAKAITDANNAIYAQLNAIDLRMIRALGEVDTQRISDYNTEKAALRAQLQ